MSSISRAPDAGSGIARLSGVDWDFAGAETGYLTHGLHPYPAKFIPQIPNALIRELSSPGETVADIFCGSGTTLLEALRLGRHAVGIDANPLAVLISRGKTTRLESSAFQELSTHRTYCLGLLEQVQSSTPDLFHDGRSFRSQRWRPDPKVCEFWFLPHVVEELAELRHSIEQIPLDTARMLCTVAFSAIIVSVSLQDSDTRYVRREKMVKPGDTVRRYLRQLALAVPAAQAMSDVVEGNLTCQILGGDLLASPEARPCHLLVTSPPYPNAYSYHLYHRTRLMWLGHDPQRFKQVEIGSHRKYSAKGRNRATPKTFYAEFTNIFQWLRGQLADRRYACFVIGDSTIDGRSIDNASLLARAGAETGFREVTRIERTISPIRKAFNPKIGKIRTENILVLRKE